ncbi:M20 metallopeptidase family protein [Phocicoccus pinnipedialis]|uniref:Putative hydrolase YxeP n=1 Tax=Phocicoccus pinnipedialis TaxID=110845 RepID=A0A6V7R4M1_9BACL|nr:amidohydrolase [Jeotgalicoccus pinnipedialis]MBP1940049.1 amidohydrolase [Jeotgalicoccus pinnipedialis]CAD2072003.1 putative hydrolase YxeP [Jeotgalicoccus pinnipedialis]
MDIKKVIEDHFEDTLRMRRHMHMYPELSFQEENTKQYIYDELKNLGIEVRRDVGGNGLVTRLHVDDEYPTIAFRADFDALPIDEEADVEFKSKNPGVMHACGHDAHTATLMTLQKILVKHKDKLPVNVVAIHQHAEELPPGGAISMIEDGALDGVDYFFGTHVSSLFPVNHIGWNYDTMYANADSFTITVNGHGGHGAEPENAIDPIVASASLISQLQTIVSRSVSPLDSAVVSVTAFNSGVAFNVIPNKAEIKGTIRTYEQDVRELIAKRIKELCTGIEVGFGVKIDVDITYGYPSLKNDVDMTDYVVDVASNDKIFIRDVVEIPSSMGAEDAAYYLQKVPGCYFSTGVGNVEKGIDVPHHNPLFNIDEEGMKAALEVFLKIIINFDQVKK